MIRQTEVDGIPTLIAPAQGPMRAGLVFRVGRADETLARGGITHLIEHLALYERGPADYHFYGSTSTTATTFHMQGTPAEVAEFLNGVCRSLGKLPMSRLDVERQILATEAASNTAGVNDPLLAWRWGAQGYGLPSFPEWGREQLTEDDLRGWVARWFTRGNAALWIAGNDIPAGLKLELPDGIRQPLPKPTPMLPKTPAFFNGGNGAIAMDTIVSRSLTAVVYSRLLERVLFRVLPHESGLSYTLNTYYGSPGGPDATITAIADALPDQQGPAATKFIHVIKDLARGEIRQSDLNAVLSQFREGSQHPELEASQLPSWAVDLLTGEPIEGIEHVRDQLDQIDVAAVTAVATATLDQMLLMLPEGHQAGWAGFAQAPATQHNKAVTGIRLPARYDDDYQMILGEDGLSFTGPQHTNTVYFDQCQAMLAFPDGGRILLGTDSTQLRLEHTGYVGTAKVLPLLDQRVGPDRIVTMPARKPDEIPDLSGNNERPWWDRFTPAGIRRRILGTPLGQQLRPLWPLTLVLIALAGAVAAVNHPRPVPVIIAGWSVYLLWKHLDQHGHW